MEIAVIIGMRQRDIPNLRLANLYDDGTKLLAHTDEKKPRNITYEKQQK